MRAGIFIVRLTAVAVSLFLPAACTTNQDLNIFWQDAGKKTIDSVILRDTSPQKLLEEINTALLTAEVEKENYHDVLELTKICVHAYPACEHRSYVDQLLILSALFSIRYNPYITADQYAYQKMYIAMGYTKEIMMHASLLRDSAPEYVRELNRMLTIGYWHDDALHACIRLVEKLIRVDTGTMSITFSIENDPYVENEIAQFRREYTKWYEDTHAERLFRLAGVSL
jgi:hypothetical protein